MSLRSASRWEISGGPGTQRAAFLVATKFVNECRNKKSNLLLLLITDYEILRSVQPES